MKHIQQFSPPNPLMGGVLVEFSDDKWRKSKNTFNILPVNQKLFPAQNHQFFSQLNKKFNLSPKFMQISSNQNFN